MKKIITLVIVVLIIIFAAYLFFKPAARPALAPAASSLSSTSSVQDSAVSSTSTPAAPSIIIFNPVRGAMATSPLTISGKARGEWFFEGTFPIVLLDPSGNVLARASAAAQGAWTTNSYVDFLATLEFAGSTSTATSGVLVFSKDNPSGLPRNDLKAELPIVLPKTK